MANLFPWREQLIKKRGNIFVWAMLTIVCTTMLTFICWNFFINSKIKKIEINNINLQKVLLDKQKKRHDMERIQQEYKAWQQQQIFIKVLQNNTQQEIILLQKLATLLPLHITFIELAKENKTITLHGETRSYTDLYSFLVNLKHLYLVKNVIFQGMQAKTNDGNLFILSSELN